jgi:hypothetical protein
MNIQILNLENSFKKDLRMYAQFSGSSVFIYPSRANSSGKNLYTIFSGESFSKFPRNSSESFVNQVTQIDFSTGSVGDGVSSSFTPISPSVGQAVIGVIAIDRNDRIFIRNNSAQSISSADFDFQNAAFPVQKGRIPLYGFMVSNESGVSKVAKIFDLRPDFNNVPFDTADVVYTNTDNFSIGSVFREYLYADAVAAQNQITIRSTKLKRGDSISIISSTTVAQVRTVLSVSYGDVFDTITLDQNLTSPVTVQNCAAITINTFSDASQVFNGGYGKVLFDFGWRSCSSGLAETLTHNLSLPLGTYYPVLYFNSTRTMNGAKTLCAFNYSATSVGVQLILTSTTTVVRFASNGIYPTLNSSGQVTGFQTTGFYRLIILGN